MKLAINLQIILQLLSSFLFGQEINLKGSWKFHIGDKEAWSYTKFDDSDWEQIYAPSAWEEQGFNGYDGFAWYRKKFDGRKLNKNEGYYLKLGFIDDVDEVYLNGKLVGFTGSMPPNFKTAYTTDRKYALPSDAINFGGDNTIAIRVFDVTHGGGIIEGNLGVYSYEKKGGLLIDLQGIWLFATSMEGEPITNEREWRNMMVPDAWEHQGKRNYDGYAWYKRTFTIAEKYTKESLVLMLGKIDDFDKVYLNGKLIGSTNDHRPLGLSHSYQKERVYEIPPQLLRKNATNTIEILVEDIGNIGGIYEGPVGITSRADYDKYFAH